jgi:hypothetical protein
MRWGCDGLGEVPGSHAPFMQFCGDSATDIALPVAWSAGGAAIAGCAVTGATCSGGVIRRYLAEAFTLSQGPPRVPIFGPGMHAKASVAAALSHVSPMSTSLRNSC